FVIRHGGQATTFNDGNILIEGTGADPTVQFVVGPNDDHTIDIDPTIPVANFEDFTTLFPAGTFPDSASGATGAILRGAGDATLVTSFQNQPFIPGEPIPEVDPPGNSPTSPTSPGTPSTPSNPLNISTTGLEQLSDDETSDEVDTTDDTTAIADGEASEAVCIAEVVDISSEAVEITATCAPQVIDETSEPE
ncbi:MAG: hypothetical protein F6K42_29370, partial [Leptolyngbya sp. SIO1D8]|nr:hypothetical protein [Leptolyngbya sp. SIO1D8]